MGTERPRVVTKDDIVRGLRELGLQKGDVVLCHTSLSSFGHVEGGAEAVVDALLETVGPSGTVCVPTALWAGSQRVWLNNIAKLDVRHSPTCLGAINNALMNRPQAVRSRHPTHPCAAVGPHAEFLTRDHHRSPMCVGGPSPFMRNIELGGKLLFLGVNIRCNTTFHAVEEHLAGYRLSGERRVGQVVDRDGKTIEVPVPVFAGTPQPDYLKHEKPMTERGIMKLGEIGQAEVRLIDARAMYDYCVECAQQDEFFLLSGPVREPEPTVVHPATEVERGRMRAELREVLGMPSEGPLGVPFLCGREEFDDVIIEDLRIAHTARPEELVPVLVAIPRDLETPAPAVLCIHGSGRSREFVMERQYRHDPSECKLYGWARELARRGFIAVAPSNLTYGGRPGRVIQERAKLDQMHGRPVMGQLVQDCLAVLDYAAGRPDVDESRIACTGFSLGGIVTFYAACLDERIRFSVPVCGGIGSLEALADRGQTSFHSTYFYVPGILQHFDHPQLLAATCPRACKVIGAAEDVGMPLDAVEELGEIGRRLYAEAGVPGSFDVVIYPGQHDLTPRMLDDMAVWFGSALDD